MVLVPAPVDLIGLNEAPQLEAASDGDCPGSVASRGVSMNTGAPQDHICTDGLPQGELARLLQDLDFDSTLTPGQLQSLRSAIDVECVRASNVFTSTVAQSQSRKVQDDGHVMPENVLRLVLYLSKPMYRLQYEGAAMCREYQLRTLISALALLHYRVDALRPTYFDTLQEQIAGLYYDLVTGPLRRDSTASKNDSIRNASALYLVRLAYQYASLFDRGEPLLLAHLSPFWKIASAIASVAGGQYGSIANILQSFDEIARLWRRPQTTFLTLPIIQEKIRNQLVLRHRKSPQSDDQQLLRILSNLTSLIKAELQYASVPSSGFWEWPRIVTRRGPRLDRSYYLYGLLDCGQQLAHLLYPDAVRQALGSEIEHVMWAAPVGLYRIKAMQICLSCPTTRLTIHHSIKTSIQTQSPDLINSISIELDAITGIIEQDDTYSGNCAPVDANLEPEIINGSGLAFQEPAMREKMPAMQQTIHRVKPSKWSSFSCAGLATGCRFVYFCQEKKVKILFLNDSGTPLPKTFSHGFPSAICRVTCSQRFMTVITKTDLSLWSVSEENGLKHIWTLGSQSWMSHDAEMLESESSLLIVLVQSDVDGQSRIAIYELDVVNPSAMTERPAEILNVVGVGRPKQVAISDDGRILACIAAAGEEHHILSWRKQGDLFEETPTRVTTYRFHRETGRGGITSLSLFSSSSGSYYICCTTSPSSERSRKGGEWSFILPIPSPGYPLPQHLVRPFPQFQGSFAPLVAGTVSIKVNVFAVLEKTGDVHLLPLNAHEDGGIHSPALVPTTILGVSMKRQSSDISSAKSSMRFDVSGTKLFAVDHTGKVLVVDFY